MNEQVTISGFWRFTFTLLMLRCVYVCLKYGKGVKQPFSIRQTASRTLRDIHAKAFLSVHLELSRKYQPTGPPPITDLTAVS